MTQFPRILLAGSFGQGNLGGEAVADALVVGLRERLPDARLRLVAGDEEAIRSRLQAETVPASDWAQIAEAMRAADLVVLADGTLTCGSSEGDAESVLGPEASGTDRLLGASLLAALLRRPFAMAGIGVGPVAGPGARSALAGVAALATHLTVRDRVSADLLAELGAQPGRLEVAADPAFLLRPCSGQRADAILDAARLEGHRDRLVAVVPASWSRADAAQHAVVAALTDFLLATDAHLLLVPFRQGLDASLLERWQASFPAGRSHLLPFGHSASEVAGVLGRCGLAVTMRRHGTILAALGGTPAVTLTPDRDVPPPWGEVGCVALALRQDDPGRSAGVLARTWALRDELRPQVASAVTDLVPSARRVVDSLVSALDAPAAPATGHPLDTLLAPAVTGLLKRAMVAGVERDRVRREGEARLARHHLSLAGQITDRDRIIRELQDELFSKVGERDRLIRGLQEELTTKIEERDRIILDLQAALTAATAGVALDQLERKDRP